MTLRENKPHDLYSEKEASYFAGARQEILPMLPPQIKSVLEVGAGNGDTLWFVSQNRPNAKTTAVEPFKAAAALARSKVDTVIEEKIENLKASDFDNAPYDVILCMDVLEHLQNPWAEIKKLSETLAPGGIIIASIPNVSHMSVLFPLLFKGRWDLVEEGVLDRTHLRFFVRSSAIALMTSGGLTLKDVRPARYHARVFSFVNKLTLGLIERFITRQYLVKVSK